MNLTENDLKVALFDLGAIFLAFGKVIGEI